MQVVSNRSSRGWGNTSFLGRGASGIKLVTGVWAPGHRSALGPIQSVNNTSCASTVAVSGSGGNSSEQNGPGLLSQTWANRQ